MTAVMTATNKVVAAGGHCCDSGGQGHGGDVQALGGSSPGLRCTQIVCMFVGLAEKLPFCTNNTTNTRFVAHVTNPDGVSEVKLGGVLRF